jgi:hypothetical protein
MQSCPAALNGCDRPLHVHERIDPRSIIEAVRRKNAEDFVQGSLFRMHPRFLQAGYDAFWVTRVSVAALPLCGKCNPIWDTFYDVPMIDPTYQTVTTMQGQVPSSDFSATSLQLFPLFNASLTGELQATHLSGLRSTSVVHP